MTQSEWLVTCRDPFGRARGMAVLAKEEDVVVVTPAGQTAVLTATQTRNLEQALRLAAEGAEPVSPVITSQP
ncbi:MAG TPA: hypothetical protein VG317_10370 [Pseudonocardiaceae bacterium]|jgi:hypothetical protein|nr:hypothetical protein [Pseudonocardiaceae bacterium]